MCYLCLKKNHLKKSYLLKCRWDFAHFHDFLTEMKKKGVGQDCLLCLWRRDSPYRIELFVLAVRGTPRSVAKSNWAKTTCGLLFSISHLGFSNFKTAWFFGEGGIWRWKIQCVGFVHNQVRVQRRSFHMWRIARPHSVPNRMCSSLRIARSHSVPNRMWRIARPHSVPNHLWRIARPHSVPNHSKSTAKWRAICSSRWRTADAQWLRIARPHSVPNPKCSSLRIARSLSRNHSKTTAKWRAICSSRWRTADTQWSWLRIAHNPMCGSWWRTRLPSTTPRRRKRWRIVWYKRRSKNSRRRITHSWQRTVRRLTSARVSWFRIRVSWNFKRKFKNLKRNSQWSGNVSRRNCFNFSLSVWTKIMSFVVLVVFVISFSIFFLENKNLFPRSLSLGCKLWKNFETLNWKLGIAWGVRRIQHHL